MHAAWQRLKMDTSDAQLRRAVRKACNWPKRVRSAVVIGFFERRVVELEKQLRMGDQQGFFQNIKAVQLEETKKVESQCVRDEEGRLLRDKGRIREIWVRFFRSLLNAKSDMLDPDIPKRLPQQPVASAPEIEPTEEEIAAAMKAMANAKAVGPDGLPAELMKFGLQQDTGPSYWSSTDSPPSSGARGKPHSSGKTRSILYSTRKAIRRSVETTAVSRSCHTRVRCSFKWLPGDLALTVRRRNFCRRSSAGFDLIARPRT